MSAAAEHLIGEADRVARLRGALNRAAFDQAASELALLAGVSVWISAPNGALLWRPQQPAQEHDFGPGARSLAPLLASNSGCAVPAREPITDGETIIALAYAVSVDSSESTPPHSQAHAAARALAALARSMYEVEGELTTAAGELAAVYEELAVVCEIGQVASSLPPGGSLLRWALERATEALRLSRSCFILIPAPGAKPLTACVGFTRERENLVTEAATAAFARRQGRLAATGLIINNPNEAAQAGAAWLEFLQGFHKALGLPWMAAPVRTSGTLLGFVVGSRAPHGPDFRPRDLRLLNAVARQVGLSLRNSRLVDEVGELFVATVRGLAAAIDAKDPSTRGHSDRVAALGDMVARRLGIPERQRHDLALTSLLHDIGKIAIPETILLKPGALTEAEWGAVRSHPERGAAIVAEVKQLRRLVPGVRHHHERFDGAGYPAGLSGHKIPLFARIIAVCDAFDAMTSPRTYRQPRSFAQALEELHRCRGTQFDPALAEALISVLRENPDRHRRTDCLTELRFAYRPRHRDPLGP